MAVFGAAIVANAATFDGNPATPLPLTTGYTDAGDGATYDVQVHSRDRSSWEALPAIDAQHGADCSAPPATHTNTSYEGAVFNCRDHMMTALNAAGYGVIYLTPNRMVDFSNEATIKFDLSTLRMSLRDWVDVWITPYEDNLTLPLEGWLPDLQGEPANFLHLRMDAYNGQTIFICPGNNRSQSLESVLASVGRSPSATTRDTFQIELSPSRFTFSMPAAGAAGVFCDVPIAPGFTSGIVQFGHHTYSPEKDGAGVPGTWHWDNISIDPAIPFTMIKADRRYTQGGNVTFAQPAPANAYLRFSAACKPVVDGVPLTKMVDGGHPEHQSSYFVPIAAGTQTINVGFTDDGWYGTRYGCIAKDFSIWSLSSSTVPTSTVPNPTATPIAPTATPSPVLATNTPTPIPSPSSTPTSTETATPTATPSPTPTSTPTPAPIDDRCSNRDWNEATSRWREVNGRWVEFQPGLWACLVPSAGRVP